jgi:hypothetical protein
MYSLREFEEICKRLRESEEIEIMLIFYHEI